MRFCLIVRTLRVQLAFMACRLGSSNACGDGSRRSSKAGRWAPASHARRSAKPGSGHSRRASSSRYGAAAHRRISFRGLIQDLLHPTLAPAAILVRTPDLHGTALVNGPPHETRLADRCIDYPAAGAGCSRSPATGASTPARRGPDRCGRGLLHEPLPSAPQSVPHLDPGLTPLRFGTPALPQGLPCDQQEGQHALALRADRRPCR